MSDAFIQSQRVDVSRVGERAVLYHRDSREALVLNPSGSWLWDQLRTPRSRDELATALQNQFRVSADQAARDVEQFLQDLRQHDAVVGSA